VGATACATAGSRLIGNAVIQPAWRLALEPQPNDIRHVLDDFLEIAVRNEYA
jgi:hypothetical protein